MMGSQELSAMGQVRQEFGVQTTGIISLNDLIAASRGKGNEVDLERLENYRREYLASD